MAKGRNATLDTLLREIEALRAREEQLSAEVEQLRESATALEASRDRYLNSYQSSPVACLTLDRVGVIRELNRSASSLLRFDRAQLLGAPLFSLLAPESRRRFLAHLVACQRSSAAMTFEATIQRQGSELIPVRLSILTTPEQDGAYTIVLLDLRERDSALADQRRLVAAERAARESSQLKDRLIATLSRGVGGPLARVFAAASKLAQRADLEDELRDSLTELQQTMSALHHGMHWVSAANLRKPHGPRRVRASPRNQRKSAGKSDDKG